MNDFNVQQEIAPCEENSPAISNDTQDEKGSRKNYSSRLTYFIALSGILAAIGVVLKFYIPTISGTFFSFFYIPCFLAGVLTGPFFAFFVGAIGDTLGTLIGGRDINILITLSSGLMGFVFGAIYHYLPIKSKLAKIIIAMVVVCIVVTLGTNTLAQLWPIKKFANFKVALASRLFQPVILLVNTIIVGALIPIVEKITKYKWKET